ncbi:MAG: ABC transporter ATP-binding protein [Clostridiales bacterium]|nr:ABC transporter ATP-binding protein [Clostridiales bacterium]
MGTDRILIKYENISKSFGDKKVIDHLDLEVKDGEFLTLLGPSGCGKTTLLRMVNGFETPDEGRILIDGKDQAESEPSKREVNTVFQNYALFPHLTVRENVAFSLKMKRTDKEEIKSRVDEILELTDLEALADRKPGKLSGGQQQRVAIARSLINHPKVLLLDEPLGALDLKLRKQMQIELRRMQRRMGITYVYVTHDQEEALTISDRIVVLNGGKIEQMGEPWDIYHNPGTEFVADFLGESNFFEGSYRGGDHGGEFLYGKYRIPVEAPEDKSANILSVRPEYVRVSAREPQTVAIPAIMKEITYLGQSYRVKLELEDKKTVYALMHEQQFETGSQVFLSWKPEDCTLIRGEK